jgi:hypothetical protein
LSNLRWQWRLVCVSNLPCRCEGGEVKPTGTRTLRGQPRNSPPAKHKTESRAYTREAHGNPAPSHYRQGMAYYDPSIRRLRESLPNMFKLLH